MYSEGRHSYRELPIRLADFGRLHRYELSGVTAGLTRVRSFSQDDAHIFCTQEQISSEVEFLIGMYLETYALFGLPEARIFLSTRPPKRAGDDDLWDHAEASLESALERSGHPYERNEGDGAFYGPKIDFIVVDALRREHQLGTVQLDYVLPERFDLRFIDAQDREQRPVMIHRAMLGSLERFFGILIEHCAGAFPPWLAPEQVRVLPITERALPWAETVREALAAAGFRATVDSRGEKIGAKIREAQLHKVPWMLVVGDRESAGRTVAVRSRRGGDQGASDLEAFIDKARTVVAQHAGEP
jgi:threonyl-tRNA synthetase